MIGITLSTEMPTMQTENTFKLSEKGKKHCEELEARRID
jgi:hypothetical protein